jgi:hypothetical protein
MGVWIQPAICQNKNQRFRSVNVFKREASRRSSSINLPKRLPIGSVCFTERTLDRLIEWSLWPESQRVLTVYSI